MAGTVTHESLRCRFCGKPPIVTNGGVWTVAEGEHGYTCRACLSRRTAPITRTPRHKPFWRKS